MSCQSDADNESGQRCTTSAALASNRDNNTLARLSHPSASCNCSGAAKPPHFRRASRMRPATQGPTPFIRRSVKLSVRFKSTGSSGAAARRRADGPSPDVVICCDLPDSFEGVGSVGGGSGKRNWSPYRSIQPCGNTRILRRTSSFKKPPTAARYRSADAACLGVRPAATQPAESSD